MTPTADGLADRFLRAVEQGDIDTVRDTVYTPETVIWHNTDNREIGPEENFRVLRWLTGVLPDMRYEEVRRRETPDGYVQQHVLRGTVPDGTAIEIRACFVVTLRGDRIVRLDEYLDTAAGRPLDPYRPTSPSA
ncbi:nuclear transport factor 2 family protein [Peterkaempfera bronchialis]|uniref:nuclear transport factor 2 family protein n=1 Tax=Peterkaempfera bronchialis TaxID=2126346 RepID=UPI003C30A630